MKGRWLTRGGWLLVIALLGGLVLTSCNPFAPDEKDKPPPPPDKDRTTALRTFDYFAWVQSDPKRDIVEYDRTMHPNYTFYFTEQDRQADPGIPEFWTKTDDVAATERMFKGGDGKTAAVTITMTLTSSQTPKATEPCDPTNPEGPTCMVYEVTVSMAVEVVETPENTTYLVNGLSDIAVTKDPVDSTLWVVYQIVDRTAELGKVTALAPSITEALQRAPEGSPVRTVSWGELRYELSRLASGAR